MPLYSKVSESSTAKIQSKTPQKYKVTVENMIYDKAISRVDGVKVIPLTTLKNQEKAKFSIEN